MTPWIPTSILLALQVGGYFVPLEIPGLLFAGWAVIVLIVLLIWKQYRSSQRARATRARAILGINVLLNLALYVIYTFPEMLSTETRLPSHMLQRQRLGLEIGLSLAAWMLAPGSRAEAQHE